ncbi:MAG: glucose-6-phosphate isomerase [Rhodobacteraceae bacterium]|nr:glucose-6-phosphate isomerase [Paracoccaceae bacterium]
MPAAARHKSSWEKLRGHHARLAQTPILHLFSAEAERGADFSLHCDGLFFDFSKTCVDQRAMNSLLELATGRGWEQRRAAMFAGQKINSSENRAVLHTALRIPEGAAVPDGCDEIHPTLSRMRKFSTDIREGRLRSASGDKFTDILNIGIGGSELGPALACGALRHCAAGPEAHFLSNIDAAQAASILPRLNPHTTLVIVTSKTFTTIETMTNARAVRRWMVETAGSQAPEIQFAAVSSNIPACAAFGINPDRVFGFGDYIGGRFSLWSPVGLVVMLALGSEAFHQMLAGAHAMDSHFNSAPERKNLPLLHALINVWHHQICGYPTRAILPYDHRLRRLPAYLQQLIMESNGKSVTHSGEELPQRSAAIIWGEPGTNGQHAFFQALHQGNRTVPCEFLIAASGDAPDLFNHHDLLIANCLAQSEALMSGQNPRGDLAAHRRCPGDRPSTTLIFPRLTPFVLGQLLALQEHSVFVEGSILDINSFDQWGVELGKRMAGRLLPLVAGEKPPGDINASTAQLLRNVHAARAAE